MIPDEGRTIAYVFTAKRVGHGVKLSTSLEDIVYSRIGSAAATSAAVARATAVAGSATEVAARELIVLLLLSISIVFSVQRVEANFRIDLSLRLRTVRASTPRFTDALIMCNNTIVGSGDLALGTARLGVGGCLGVELDRNRLRRKVG